MSGVLDVDRTPLPGSTVVIGCTEPETDLARRISASIRLGTRHVVVDLGEVEMVDSSTLSTLKRIAGYLRSRGGSLSVVSANPGLSKLLHLTLLSRSFRVVQTVDAALRTTP